MREMFEKIRNLIDEYGYETYRKASFVEMLGAEDKLGQADFEDAIDKLYEYYMDTDYYSSPLDTNLIDKFYEYYDVDNEE